MFKINERNLIGIVFTGFIVIFVIGLVLSNCYSVNTGEVAVISTFGKITRIDTEGLNFKIHFVKWWKSNSILSLQKTIWKQEKKHISLEKRMNKIQP